MLVEALDETIHPPQRYTEQELAAVLQQRIADIESGRAELIDADEVIGKARLRLMEQQAARARESKT